MQSCDYETAIKRASRVLELDEENGNYKSDDKLNLIIEFLTALYPDVPQNTVMSDLSHEAEERIDDNRTEVP